jgi:hypothetical protein
VNTWKVIFATMIIFGAGVVTGGLLVRHTALVPPPKNTRAGTNLTNSWRPLISMAPALIRVDFLRRAERDLNLSHEQKEQADKIISASQDRTKKLLEPISPQIREELQQTKDQFRALLNPDQQARFDQMLKQQGHPRESRHPSTRTTDISKPLVPAAEPERKE